MSYKSSYVTYTHTLALFLATPDDKVTSRRKQAKAPRDNIIFELGLFVGTLGMERAFFAVPIGSAVKLPSDIDGIIPIKYKSDNSTAEQAASLIATQVFERIKDLGPR